MPFAFLFQTAPAAGNPATGTIFMLVAMFAIVYFLIFLPMQRQKKSQAAMLASLEAGNEILTSGGIVGTIVNITGDMLIVRVKPDNIKLQIARTAVSSVVQTEKSASEKK
ncbi:MAG TPA: preprotein translocase subunit YajC [Bryobacteraceae bacterium]|jgi:preprotein translocase subunit YajC